MLLHSVLPRPSISTSPQRGGFAEEERNDCNGRGSCILKKNTEHHRSDFAALRDLLRMVFYSNDLTSSPRGPFNLEVGLQCEMNLGCGRAFEYWCRDKPDRERRRLDQPGIARAATGGPKHTD